MKNLILLSLLLYLCSPLYAQNKILISYNPGMSLHNSENSTKIIGDKHIAWFPGISLAYATENLWGLNVLLEYNYSSKRIYDVQTLATTSSADLILTCNNFDVAVYYKANEWLSFAAGPTMSLVNRTIVIDNLLASGLENVEKSFEDRLVSFCLGVNGSVSIEVPLQTAAQYVFFFSNVKLRYLHSVWFDDRGRNLSNYYQSFLFGQLNIGLGYNF